MPRGSAAAFGPAFSGLSGGNTVAMVKFPIKKKPVALSQTVKVAILEYVEQMSLQPDEPLPTEAELVEKLGVSRHTVREALALLQQDNIIYKIQGKGTFLKRNPIHLQSGLERLESIHGMTAQFGYKPRTEWLGIDQSLPNVHMMEELSLSPQDPVITFRRVKLADDKIIAYCVDTIPRKVLQPALKGLDDLPSESELDSVFGYLEQKLGIVIEQAVSEIVPIHAPRELREKYGLSRDQLFTLLHQIHYDQEGRALIYSMDYFNKEYMRFKVNRQK